MKQKLITEVMQQMLPYLDNAQLKQLKQVMEQTLFHYEVIGAKVKPEEDNSNDLIAMFIAAKRIEGCSGKTLKYYRTTIDAMVSSLGKSVRHILTEDLRTYLTEYQSKNQSSRITIDNIRRILSSFTTGTDLERSKAISGAVNFIVGVDKEREREDFLKEALLLRQALSLCSSLAEESMRIEAAFFESVRVLVMRLMNQGEGKKISLPEMNARINALLEQSIKSSGVINLFSDVNGDFSLFDPKFLEEIGKMKEKNLAVELLKKLISEQVIIYKRTNVVKSQKFSEIIQQAMNRYLNGMLTNEQVIEELLNLAKQIQAAQKEGEQLGLTADELAFYDALTKPQAIKDFYENEELIAITKELAETLRKNKTIDWQKRDSARAKMRMLIKKLLKKHRYPPEGMDDAVQTVMTQCELWTDNNDMSA